MAEMRELTAAELEEGARAYEKLQAQTAPIWERLTRQSLERARLDREHEEELARWEGEGGLVGPPPWRWFDEVVRMLRQLGRLRGN